MKIGSHVGMSGKEMFLGSVKEALSYGADTLMVYTGAPQNTRRKAIEELRVEEGWELMKANGMDEIQEPMWGPVRKLVSSALSRG